jgi:hypothetical protein
MVYIDYDFLTNTTLKGGVYMCILHWVYIVN